MAESRNDMADDLAVEVNGEPHSSGIGERPAESASKEKWAAYVVALGLHPDASSELSKSELTELAGRLGG